ncbi:MAG: tetratricopeptide repeat protein [Pirellulaceae bacterium]
MAPTRTPGSLLASCSVWLFLLVLAQASLAQQKPADKDQPLEQRIASLIEQLGDDNFNQREFAQRQLRLLGLQAYDAVHRAQQHDDIEIAKRAHYLVRSMRIQWSHVDDPAPVRRILVGYGKKSPEERRNRMEQLVKLEQGRLILCRMVRYETSAPLSKYAALLIMRQGSTSDDPQTAMLAASLRDAVHQSARVAASWIRAHAKTLEDPESALGGWQQICHQEETTLTLFPQQTTREITRDLLRHHAQLLHDIDHQEESMAVLRRTINLLDGTRGQLLEMVAWLGEKKFWSLIQDVADRFPGEFSKYADLAYFLAESHLEEGNKEKADQAAARARAIDPDNTRVHTLMALQLQRRNLIPWAIEEYRLVLEKADLKSQDSLYARFLLSEVLHDLGSEVEAAAVLDGAVEAVSDERTERQVEQIFGRTRAGIRSRQLYFLAQAKLQEQMLDEQKNLLEQAIESDPSDGDVLIAMYRFKNADEAYKKRTRTLIEATVEHHRVEIELYDNTFHNSGDPTEQETARRKLAGANNQLAWLVCNTVGDYKEALRSSLRSLELRPGSSSYLDTLGHCYYAVGDYEKAVESQQQAVDGEPSSQQMLRMLKVFKDALEASQKEK